MEEHKPLYRYAGTIKRDWTDISGLAKEYVDKMYKFDQLTEEGARAVVVGFYQNSSKWKGLIAVQVKKELCKLANIQVT